MFYDILLLKQNFFSQYIHHLRSASKFALFQGVCMDDGCTDWLHIHGDLW